MSQDIINIVGNAGLILLMVALIVILGPPYWEALKARAIEKQQGAHLRRVRDHHDDVQ